MRREGTGLVWILTKVELERKNYMWMINSRSHHREEELGTGEWKWEGDKIH